MALHDPTPYEDVYQLIHPGPQSMHGFDADYPDIVAYIIRCTYKIWEGKQISLINTHYAQDSMIHTPNGDIIGSQTVLNNTVQQLSLFPDRRLFPEDVIWSGDDQAGYYSSHRIRSTATHRGESLYGAPTGKRIKYRVIADCIVKENKIIEEWLVRDDLHIIRQLGLDERAFVQKLVHLSPEKYTHTSQLAAGNQTASFDLLPVTIENFNVEGFIKNAWHSAWNLRQLDSFKHAYLSIAICHSASGRELFGSEELTQFVIDWLACFPDGQMHFDHFCSQGNESSGYRTSMRWTFTGTHLGYGIYGKPSGKPVRIMGITQAFVRSGKILEEWTVFDELNLLCQIYVSDEAI